MTAVPRAPPASREVVAKLPVITLTEEIVAKMGSDAECAICRENLQVNDKMQELPCEHTFHPPCLKPWLVSYTICFSVHVLYGFLLKSVSSIRCFKLLDPVNLYSQ